MNISLCFRVLTVIAAFVASAKSQEETATVSPVEEASGSTTFPLVSRKTEVTESTSYGPLPDNFRRIVRFQVSEIATTNSYLIWKGGEVPTMYALTMCLRARLEHFSLAQSTFVSYFPNGEDQLTLFFDWEAHHLVLGAYSNSIRSTIYNATIPLYTWFTFCISIDFDTDSYSAILGPEYSTGELPKSNNEGKDRVIPGGGTLVIAQEQDKPGGLFSIGQMFSGDMADFILFSKVLSEKEMLRYVSCGDTPSSDVVASFTSLQGWDVIGETEIAIVNKSVLCDKKEKEFFVFPEQRIFPEAEKMCEKLSLPMALPESEEENQKLFKLAVAVESLCLSSYSTNVWIGAIGDIENEEWLDYNTGSPIIYDNLDKRYRYITEESHCISQGGSFYPAIWYTTFCSRFKPCTACEDAPKSSIKIRGLCRDSRLDRELHVHGLKNQKPMLQGTFYSNVFWNNFTWVMTSRNYPDIRAEMRIAFIDDYPIGLQRWHIEGDVCPDKDMDLMMTVCGEESFTCNDGTCVKISQRCDLKVNCDDKSDEVDCARAQVGLDYASHIPPPPPKKKDTITVTMDIIITAVRNLNLLDQKLSLDVTLVLQWEDSRLKYANLQEQMNRNLIDDKDKLWIPRLVITDDTGSQVDFQERRAALVVIKESDPLPDDDTNVKEGECCLSF
ncbi:hypothetical protein SK128_010943 [Halocaridina rubra]|uniref:Pentraxin (PTX) domain-containing protein n=1 Tax=Halocaridina rubra TaxID=373956 RepID=A0AAN8X8N2_HALRR